MDDRAATIATTSGKCYFCQGIFSKDEMTIHLERCPQRHQQAPLVVAIPTLSQQEWPQARYFQLQVEGSYRPAYWLHLEIPTYASLLNLDSFLRYVWLECCGHLSAFELGPFRYASSPDKEYGLKEKSMRGPRLEIMMSVGNEFTYEYDYGTTTKLNLKVVGEREGAAIGHQPTICLMARNEPPLIPCEKCRQGKAEASSQICMECIWHGEGWLCDKHARAHKEHADFFLPVVNSPRVGQCGYTGKPLE
ncbi:MAG TPA: hypothetical protein VH186_03575 [Chloroflexia bacterium]|nr:hypothetical protein [Chloroflexia bacterium]